MKIQQTIVLVILAVTLVACMCSVFATDPVSIAQSRVQIGDTRTEAVQALSDAWFHSECTYIGITEVDDLFLYGPRDRNQVKMVIVSSDVISGTLRVVSVRGFESYMLPQYDHCIPSPLQAFEDDMSTPTPTTTS